VLVRRAASSDTLRSLDLRDVRILHFATHALLDDRSLQRNLLALSPGRHDDGTLDPDALGALAINRALVVLSGCHTVGGIVLGAEGLRGLTAPLLEAGARAVVATQWAIGDQSTLPFIDRLYAHLAGGDDVATALRSAKKDAIRAHVRPAVWAAFTLVGDGTMRAPLSPAAGALLPWGRAIAAH
jgi:CHAT domain-containing protein